MKYEGGTLQKSQREFLKLAAEQGMYCVVCYTADDAIEIIKRYVSRDTVHPNLAILKKGKQTGIIE